MYLASITAANVAFILLIIGHFLSFGPQLSECINHNTTYDVAEQEFKEDEVDEVCCKACCF